MLTDQKIINNWLYAFARNVDKQKLSDHVLSYGNFLWHVFSYEYVLCFKGDEAREKFDRIAYDKAIRFHDGYEVHMLLTGRKDLRYLTVACEDIKIKDSISFSFKKE